MKQLIEAWEQFEGFISADQNLSAWKLGLYLLIAGALSLYIRWLYKKCSASPSDTESISRVFPLLAIVTAGVIAVVKSSLALSLGLVGALSIVRFRAAIKDPEELIYLFLAIAVGLALGAEQPLLAVAVVAVSTVFIVGMSFAGGRQRQQRLLLTITGDSRTHFTDDESGVMSSVDAVVGRYTLQRFDVDNGRAQVRIVLDEANSQKTTAMLTQLRKRLPDCEMSYVNLNSTL